MIDKKDIVEMERAFLGSILIAAENGKVETRLKPDDFESKIYGKIFETILKQLTKGITPSIVTLHNELLSANISASTIADLTTAIVSDVNINYYESQVFKASKTRLFIRLLRSAQEEIDHHTDIDTVIKTLILTLSAVTVTRNEVGIMSAAELLRTHFSEIRWIVPGLIGDGLTLICGAPKIGKSWFVLNLAIAAATGGVFLGTIAAVRTDTLYLALEDTERRIQSRLKKLKAPEATDNLKITTQWQDGYTGLEYYLKNNRKIGLVIIDTLAIFTNIVDMNDYTITTNAMVRLKRIADDLNVAIILIHHAKKTVQKFYGGDWMESSLGSTGLTGATDSTIFITRNRTQKETKNTAKLYATGRDAADIMHDLKLDVDCGGWTIASNEKLDKKHGITENSGTGLNYNWNE
jgi:replicative DNA helicase